MSWDTRPLKERKWYPHEGAELGFNCRTCGRNRYEHFVWNIIICEVNWYLNQRRTKSHRLRLERELEQDKIDEAVLKELGHPAELEVELST